jgi:hypothetical protein
MSHSFLDRTVATLKLGGRSAGRSIEPIHFKLKSIGTVSEALQVAGFDSSASVSSDGGAPPTAELLPIPRSTTTLPHDATSLPRRLTSLSPSDASSCRAYQPGACCCK